LDGRITEQGLPTDRIWTAFAFNDAVTVNRQPHQRENERLHGEAKDGARDGVLGEAGLWFWYAELVNQVM
jgi:hypothetical protein